MRPMNAVLYEVPNDGPPHLRSDDPPGSRQVPEPVFNNLPWPVLLLTAAIVGGYAIQSRFSLQGTANAFAFSPLRLAEGEWGRLVTALFMHASWPHAVMNGAFVLAFGVPVARAFGTRPLGVILFFTFYLACGVLANLVYGGIYWGLDVALLGGVGGGLGPDGRLRAFDRGSRDGGTSVLAGGAWHGSGVADREHTDGFQRNRGDPWCRGRAYWLGGPSGRFCVGRLGDRTLHPPPTRGLDAFTRV